LGHAELLRLRSCLPQLEELSGRVEGSSISINTRSQDAKSTFLSSAWPSALLRLSIDVNAVSDFALQLLVDSLPLSAPGLSSFELRGPPNLNWSRPPQHSLPPALDLSSLLHLSCLTDLTTSYRLLPVHSAVVMRLSSLKSLSAAGGHWHTEELKALLLQDPALPLQKRHQLQCLQRFDISWMPLGSDTLACLLTLPGLTELRPRIIGAMVYADLKRFSKLRALDINAGMAVQKEEQVQPLLEGLRGLDELSEIRLISWRNTDITATFLQGLIVAVPSLRCLECSHCRLPALQSLRGLPLTELRLMHCESTPSLGEQLLALGSILPRLEVLVLEGVSLSSDERAHLQPPSHSHPSLRTFQLR
jgi:hypothetical protein